MRNIGVGEGMGERIRMGACSSKYKIHPLIMYRSYLYSDNFMPYPSKNLNVISRVERKTMVTQTYFWNPCLEATWTPL